MNPKTTTLYSFILIAISILFPTIFGVPYNPSSDPSIYQILVLGLFPLISLCLAIFSLRKSTGKIKVLNIIIILASLLLLVGFILAAMSHCGFYSGKCR